MLPPFSLGVFAGGVPEGGGGACRGKTGGSEPGANTPSRDSRTPSAPRGEGEKGIVSIVKKWSVAKIIG